MWSSLLAQAGLWESSTERFRGDGLAGMSLASWGVLLSTLGAAWWVSAIYFRRRGGAGRKYDNPKRLFRDLCRAQKLSWTEIALAEQLAEARGLEHPAVLFVRDDYFEVADLTDSLRAQSANVEALREKLFANVT